MDTAKKKLVGYGVLGLFVLFLLVRTATGNMDGPFSAQGLGMWIAAFLSLCILSFLYDDNPFYKFAEHLFIGVSAAYYMVLGVWEQLIKNLLVKTAPELAGGLVEKVEPVAFLTRLWYFVPLILGILLIWRLSPKGGWIARWPLAFIVGWAAGTNLVRYLVSDFTKQVDPTFIPLFVLQDGSIAWIPTVSAFVTVFGLLAGLIYFFFSVEHKGAFGAASRAGIWILMITFGAAFGYTVMGRIALLVGRMEFLFVDWLEMFAP
jgi:hypothetical protein